MAGIALAVAGFAAGARRLPWAGLLVGSGAGIGFLAKGLIAPGIVGTMAVALPLFFRDWRHRAYGRLLVLAALSALPWLIVWPTTLYLRSPELFRLWYWDNNIGRLLGFSVPYLGAEKEPGFLWQTSPWFLFPGWIFAALALWRQGSCGWRQPAVQIGMTLLLTMCLLLGLSASARAVYLLPMIVGVALLGSGAAGMVPAWIDRALAAIGILIGFVALVLFWLVWGTMIASGHAPDWPWLTRWLPADFVMPISPLEVTVAIALTVGAMAAIAKTMGRRGNGLLVWTLALTLAWGLTTTLWLPWIDSARSYRAVFESLAVTLPRDATCISSRGVGEGERSMLEYIAKLRTQREEVFGSPACPVLLVESKAAADLPPDEPWALMWSGARLGDARESFRLYRFDPGDMPPVATIRHHHPKS